MAARPPGPTTTQDVRTHVAGYHVTGVLGEGASGVVFAAISANGRPVALKVLKPELVSARERQRFLEEAVRLGRVRHPSLVELVDAGPLPDGGAYIAMARLEGQNLCDRLQHGPMRFDRALALFEQIAGALGALHHAGLVHRDIKPENIFVERGDARALLLDLGIARDVAADPSTTTRAGMIRGTPAYMAPERFFGQSATPQTDLYELAVVLYVTLVGALPWSSADNPSERLRPLLPSSRGVILPPRLQSTIMQALSSEPAERPRTAETFAAAVIDALSPESIESIVAQRTTPNASVMPALGAMSTAVSLAHVPSGAARRPAAFKLGHGIAVGVTALVLFGAVGALGAFLTLRSNESSAGAPNADAGAAIAPPATSSSAITPSTSVALPAPSAVLADAKLPATAKKAPAAPRAKCRCYPNDPTSLHGGNVALARTATTLTRCECRSKNGNVCLGPLNPCTEMKGARCGDSFSKRCSKRFDIGKVAGTECSGVVTAGGAATGKLDCQFELADTSVYTGNEGANCTGFRVSGDKTEGFLRCD